MLKKKKTKNHITLKCHFDTVVDFEPNIREVFQTRMGEGFR
jgi:hypothetical protein